MSVTMATSDAKTMKEQASSPAVMDAVLRTRARPFEAVVIGGSAGSWGILTDLLSSLPGDYPLPVLIVLHVHPEQDEHFAAHFSRSCALRVRQAQDKDPIRLGEVTFAPPDFHLLVEWDKSISLSADAKVSFSRPSIDVLFESAGAVYGPGLAGILLSGASRDGTAGIRRINELGGLTVVQAPQTAEHALMPLSALEAASPTLVLSPKDLGTLVQRLPIGAQEGAPYSTSLSHSPFTPDRNKP